MPSSSRPGVVARLTAQAYVRFWSNLPVERLCGLTRSKKLPSTEFISSINRELCMTSLSAVPRARLLSRCHYEQDHVPGCAKQKKPSIRVVWSDSIRQLTFGRNFKHTISTTVPPWENLRWDKILNQAINKVLWPASLRS